MAHASATRDAMRKVMATPLLQHAAEVLRDATPKQIALSGPAGFLGSRHLDVCLCLGFVGAAVSRGVCTVPYTPSRASPNQRRRREISAAAAACET